MSKARKIRRRTDNEGSVSRSRKVTIRATRHLSNELASLQGLMYRHGKRETLAELMENLFMPCLRAYVKPYATKAAKERLAK